MLRHLALIEHDVPLRIDAAGKEGGRHFARRLRQFRRILPNRDGMQVNHAIDAIVGRLQGNELDDRAEVIAEVQIARRLDAGKYPLFESHARHFPDVLPDGTAQARGARGGARGVVGSVAPVASTAIVRRQRGNLGMPSAAFDVLAIGQSCLHRSALRLLPVGHEHKCLVTFAHDRGNRNQHDTRMLLGVDIDGHGHV